MLSRISVLNYRRLETGISEKMPLLYIFLNFASLLASGSSADRRFFSRRKYSFALRRISGSPPTPVLLHRMPTSILYLYLSGYRGSITVEEQSMERAKHRLECNHVLPVPGTIHSATFVPIFCVNLKSQHLLVVIILCLNHQPLPPPEVC